MGTIVWLSSELMFFAALFAMYFTIRSVNRPASGRTGGLAQRPVLGDEHDRPGAVLLTCQLGVFAAEKGDVPKLRLWFISRS